MFHYSCLNVTTPTVTGSEPCTGRSWRDDIFLHGTRSATELWPSALSPSEGRGFRQFSPRNASIVFKSLIEISSFSQNWYQRLVDKKTGGFSWLQDLTTSRDPLVGGFLLIPVVYWGTWEPPPNSLLGKPGNLLPIVY